MFCTPIFIHSFVVFIRLYWFERKFQTLVKEARHFRRSRSRTKTEVKDDPEANAEKSIRGRSIVVLHNKDEPANHEQGNEGSDDKGESGTTSESSQTRSQQQPAPFHRNITFADEVARQDHNETEGEILPRQISREQHIAIRENQRNPKDTKTLRIPGPKDFDRGREPEPLDDVEDGGAAAQTTSSPRENGPSNLANADKQGEKGPFPNLKMNIAAFPRLSKRKSDPKDMANAPTEDIQPLSARLRARTGTFSSLKEWASKDNNNIAPYLSWQPTIGRNSAFVDLTEEQREELGGIEYRSLKTLAVVLVCE